MSLDHFIVRRRTIRDAGGKAYVCRGPTVATIHRALMMYGTEIMTVRGAWTESIDPLTMIRETVKALASLKDERVREVLATCVDGDVFAAPPALLAQAAEVCLALGDLQRIAGGIKLPDPEASSFTDNFSEEEEEDEDALDKQTIGIIRLAKEFHCQPTAILDWPYEAMADATDVVEAMIAQPEPGEAQPQDPATIPGMAHTDLRG